ncbi:MAG TPA: response regulator [Blastocatellia bacterium]|jgi:CheY-like chemotaxis protein|nr:response regulator [Blastocatellia bacterium]
MPKKILVVEDNVDTLELMSALLQMEGYAVVTAENGQEGINLAVSERPHLIITDINMPLLSGTDMINVLRQNPEFNSTPIIAVTAYGRDGAERARQVGANEVLTKPVEYDLFRDYIRSLLD